MSGTKILPPATVSNFSECHFLANLFKQNKVSENRKHNIKLFLYVFAGLLAFKHTKQQKHIKILKSNLANSYESINQALLQLVSKWLELTHCFFDQADFFCSEIIIDTIQSNNNQNVVLI